MNRVEAAIRDALGDDIVRLNYKCGGSRRKGWIKRLRQDERTFRTEAMQLVEEHWRALAEMDVRLFVGGGVFEIAPGKFADGFEIDDPFNVPARPSAYDQVFALPGLPVLDVIEVAEVGSHNAPPDDAMMGRLGLNVDFEPPAFLKAIPNYKQKVRAVMKKQPHGERPWTFVRNALEKVMGICPFEIQMADKAGLIGTFLKRATVKQSEKITKLVFEVNPEAGDVVVEELKARGIKVADMKIARGVPDYEIAMQTYISEAGHLRMWWD